jgi:hypothetical protein
MFGAEPREEWDVQEKRFHSLPRLRHRGTAGRSPASRYNRVPVSVHGRSLPQSILGSRSNLGLRGAGFLSVVLLQSHADLGIVAERKRNQTRVR